MMFPTIYIRKTEETLLNINIVPCTFENMYLGSFSKCRVCRKFEHPTRRRKLTPSGDRILQQTPKWKSQYFR